MKLGNENGLPTLRTNSVAIRERSSLKGSPATSDEERIAPSELPRVTDRQAGLRLGFLTVRQDAAGFIGGYLVTNAWGRPLEFRLTTPVRPNRVQEILYGTTLADYIHADLIGKTLVEKTGIAPDLIVADTAELLALTTRVNIPVLAIGQFESLFSFEHPRSTLPLTPAVMFAREEIESLLNEIDSAIDLAEPFVRIREAIDETRSSGASRAA